MEGLTERQYNILAYVKYFVSTKHKPPTYQEIGDRFDITKLGARFHMLAIRKKGFVSMSHGKSRSIDIGGGRLFSFDQLDGFMENLYNKCHPWEKKLLAEIREKAKERFGDA